MNDHTGSDREGLDQYIGRYGRDNRNVEGQRLLEMCSLNGWIIPNRWFKKRDSQLYTYYSGRSKTQIDMINKADRDEWWWTEEVQTAIEEWSKSREELERQPYSEARRRFTLAKTAEKWAVKQAKKRAEDYLYHELENEPLVAQKKIYYKLSIGCNLERKAYTRRLVRIHAGQVTLYKSKRNIRECDNYRGIKLLSQMMKCFHKILDSRMRVFVEPYLGEDQFGFRKGRGAIDAMFIVRQMMERKLELQQESCWGFLDLEKAYDKINKGMIPPVLRLYHVSEKLINMVIALYRTQVDK
ncbi:Hypothetical predicted protein [Paramuricea clavata]|uniref:Reverse transcriptase domain-containing protein n=1 Tax=Paramuricea clavata TaxID=317549 RepID=A0A7D9JAR5_PARCT|nr:Hypothetical predicted protein [Paramuricea clavata]